MSIQSSQSVSSRPDEIELAHRTPLPPSTSTFFAPSDPGTQSHEDSVSSDSRDVFRGMNESLPPTDTGFAAWSFLAAAFVVDAIVWGFPNAYGVFLDVYLRDPRFISQKDATSLLPLIGTLSSGIIYCAGAFVNPIAYRYPQHRRKSMWLGAVLCPGALFGASYATTISQLIVLQGIFYGIGAVLMYTTCTSYMSEWFVARRGMANGILFAGTSAGGLLLPLLLPPMISKYGTPKTLRILGIAIAILLVILLPLMKPRLPQTRVHVHGPAPRGTLRPQDWLQHHRSFLVFLAANTLQGFGYFVPILYLPTFANALHISSSNSAITLTMVNAASFVGRLGIGYLSDKINPWILALANLLTTSVATFVLWGILSHSFAGLLVFGVVYGSIASGWTSVWTGFVRPLAKDDPAVSTTIYGYLLLFRGIGNILSTPISAKLYNQPHNVTGGLERTGFDVGEGKFETMIIYVGTCFAAAAVSAVLGYAMDVRKGRGTGGRESE
ncbi:major facilitator superfamily domain-containing protein [Mycena polygramma]|nr:major facilitator superfamily domain-containing protein [Mycena polygramma]